MRFTGFQLAPKGHVRCDLFLPKARSKTGKRPLGSAAAAQASVDPLTGQYFIRCLIDREGTDILMIAAATERAKARRKLSAAPVIWPKVFTSKGVQINQVGSLKA